MIITFAGWVCFCWTALVCDATSCQIHTYTACYPDPDMIFISTFEFD